MVSAENKLLNIANHYKTVLEEITVNYNCIPISTEVKFTYASNTEETVEPNNEKYDCCACKRLNSLQDMMCVTKSKSTSSSASSAVASRVHVDLPPTAANGTHKNANQNLDIQQAIFGTSCTVEYKKDHKKRKQV